MSQREIDRLSFTFMHLSYRAIRLRRVHWNTHDWYERLARRAIPFLTFVRDHHFPRSPKARTGIDDYVTMTHSFLAYARKMAALELATNSALGPTGAPPLVR